MGTNYVCSANVRAMLASNTGPAKCIYCQQSTDNVCCLLHHIAIFVTSKMIMELMTQRNHLLLINRNHYRIWHADGPETLSKNDVICNAFQHKSIAIK